MKWPMHTRQEIFDSNSDNILSIYMIRKDEEHRVNDVEFETVKFLFECQKDPWTLSVVELDYFNIFDRSEDTKEK